ncbi:hypothetical protein V8C44DRAFT_323099 [Trichoderma aethiopicum]
MHRHRLYQQAGLPLWNHVVNAECSPAILTSVCFPRWVEHWFWRRERDVPWFVLLTSGFYFLMFTTSAFSEHCRNPLLCSAATGRDLSNPSRSSQDFSLVLSPFTRDSSSCSPSCTLTLEKGERKELGLLVDCAVCGGGSIA